MSYDYGPLRTYELTWRSGHIERIQGHQVMFDSHKADAGGILSAFGVTVKAPAQAQPPQFTIHGMFGEHWRLMISAPEADLLSIRDVTDVVGVQEITEGGAS